jgi:saccharopine dehydrogenase (NAD+, L-lysine-forming)
MLSFGILKEWKNPPDKRAVLTPHICKVIKDKYPQVSICFEPSNDRIFTDEMYEASGINKCDTLHNCDILLGVKEIPVEKLLPNKTYLFFAHVIKKQPHNRKLMQALILNKIRMIDFETLKDKDGNRIIGFGAHAGMAGAYNGLLTYGKKHNLFDLPHAYTLKGYEEAVEIAKATIKGNFKIVLTGTGRVGKGAFKFLKDVGIQELSPHEFLIYNENNTVFTHLGSSDLFENKLGLEFCKNEFYKNPENFASKFNLFASKSDLLINGVFWHEKIPRLFEKDMIQEKSFNISVIADISCDIEGSVPITFKATDIYHPTYGVSRNTLSITEPYMQDSIDVMAVANLPCELAKDASELFAEMFLEHIIPEFLKEGKSEILERATICADGKLYPDFAYLADYASK